MTFDEINVLNIDDELKESLEEVKHQKIEPIEVKKTKF